MTPKEKAKELFDFYIIYMEEDGSWAMDNNAKKCAIRAVDEVIESGVKWMPQIEWWMAVKKEIENL